MKLTGSGKVRQLSSIGYGSDYRYNYITGKNESMQERYDRAMQSPRCSIVIASLTLGQKAGIKLLHNNGFEAVEKAHRNPNSGNKILLFAKKIAKKSKKKR